MYHFIQQVRIAGSSRAPPKTSWSTLSSLHVCLGVSGLRAVSDQRESRARGYGLCRKSVAWFPARVDVLRARNIRILARRREQHWNLEGCERRFTVYSTLLVSESSRMVCTQERCRLRQLPPTLRLWFDLSGIRSNYPNLLRIERGRH
jgi:hypothetical protein